jgi:hypothetical protein
MKTYTRWRHGPWRATARRLRPGAFASWGLDKFLEDLNPKTWFKNSGAKDLVNQAMRQLKAAKGTGIPIRWHVAEEKTAEAIRLLFQRNDVVGIEVVYTPPL